MGETPIKKLTLNLADQSITLTELMLILETYGETLSKRLNDGKIPYSNKDNHQVIEDLIADFIFNLMAIYLRYKFGIDTTDEATTKMLVAKALEAIKNQT